MNEQKTDWLKARVTVGFMTRLFCFSAQSATRDLEGWGSCRTSLP